MIIELQDNKNKLKYDKNESIEQSIIMYLFRFKTCFVNDNI